MLKDFSKGSRALELLLNYCYDNKVKVVFRFDYLNEEVRDAFFKFDGDEVIETNENDAIFFCKVSFEISSIDSDKIVDFISSNQRKSSINIKK